jgi:hypothetical protein
MRKAYLEWDTLWIIDELFWIAYETRDYKERPAPNEIFISHDMSERHSTSISEIKELWETQVPLWFYNMSVLD